MYKMGIIHFLQKLAPETSDPGVNSGNRLSFNDFLKSVMAKHQFWFRVLLEIHFWYVICAIRKLDKYNQK